MPPALIAVVLSDRDLDAYVAGTRTKIRYLRRALRSSAEMGWTEMDSIGAHAAGMSVERFRELTRAVETALKQHMTVARGPELDSLRIELLLLRVRAEERHE